MCPLSSTPSCSPPASPTWGDALARGVTFHPPADWVLLDPVPLRARSAAPIRGEVTMEALLIAEELLLPMARGSVPRGG